MQLRCTKPRCIGVVADSEDEPEPLERFCEGAARDVEAVTHTRHRPIPVLRRRASKGRAFIGDYRESPALSFGEGEPARFWTASDGSTTFSVCRLIRSAMSSSKTSSSDANPRCTRPRCSGTFLFVPCTGFRRS